jgi:ketosteroid isomerase-like protein
MSRENVELVYRAYDAIRRHDIEAFVREQHPDVVGVVHIMQAEGTTYIGHSGMRRFLDDMYSVFPDLHPEVVQAEDHGDTVLAEIRVAGRGVGSGVAVEQNIWQVLMFRDGKAVSFHGYGSRAEALEAVGLGEQDARADSS